MERYDVVIIGGGPGGYVAAIRCAQLGQRVALVEKRAVLGGTCLNVGCIPSKALLESSEHYDTARNKFKKHGIEVAGLSLDLAQMMARKERIVDELRAGIAFLMKKNKITVLQGVGQLLAANRVAVEADGKRQEIGAQSVILASGSVPVELPFLPFDGVRIVSSTEALAFESVPRSLIVIGAGAIGLELGSVWSRLGSEVTVIELLPRVAPMADYEISKVLQRALQKQGLTFLLKHKVVGADLSAEGVTVRYQTPSGEAAARTAERLLVAVGRRPYTVGLGLEQAGVRCDGRGYVVVDPHYRTSLPNVFAIGDLVEGAMLAHKAEDEGVAVAEIIAGKPGHVNYDAIPNIIYTWPELAEVGLSEERAVAAGHSIRVGRFPFKSNGRAKTLDHTDGMVKLIACAQSDRVLGAHIVGPRASEMIAELVIAMEFGASAEDLARTVHAHPTLSEIVKEAALDVDDRALHG